MVSKKNKRRVNDAAFCRRGRVGLPDADAGVLELAFNCESDGVAGSYRDGLGVVVVAPANAMEGESDHALIADQVTWDLEGLVACCRDLRESVGSAVVDDE